MVTIIVRAMVNRVDRVIYKSKIQLNPCFFSASIVDCSPLVVNGGQLSAKNKFGVSCYRQKWMKSCLNWNMQTNSRLSTILVSVSDRGNMRAVFLLWHWQRKSTAPLALVEPWNADENGIGNLDLVYFFWQQLFIFGVATAGWHTLGRWRTRCEHLPSKISASLNISNFLSFYGKHYDDYLKASCGTIALIFDREAPASHILNQ